MTAMSPTPPTPRRASIGSRRSPAAEEAILDAASALLTEQGYAGCSIEAVARRAGAGKPTVYRWWPTKADLFIAIYHREKSRAVPVPDVSRPDSTLLGDLTGYTRDLWRFWHDNPAGAAFRGLIAEAQGGGKSLEALRDKFLPDRLRDARIIFAGAVARGAFPAAAVDDRITLWVGFLWFHLLLDQLDADPAYIRRMIAPLVAVDPTEGR